MLLPPYLVLEGVFGGGRPLLVVVNEIVQVVTNLFGRADRIVRDRADVVIILIVAVCVRIGAHLPLCVSSGTAHLLHAEHQLLARHFVGHTVRCAAQYSHSVNTQCK